MPSHINIRNRELYTSFEGVLAYQKLAEQYGIKDIFQDAGGKMVQILIQLGLDLCPERKGPDAKDRSGNFYEIKTLDINNRSKAFTTNHHLTENTVESYRERKWVFGVYNHIELMELYLVDPEELEQYFETWLSRLEVSGRNHLNNPTIPLKFVRNHGKLAYSKEVVPEWMVAAVENSKHVQ